MFTTNLNAHLGPLASHVPGTLMDIKKRPLLGHIVFRLGSTNFAHVIIGIRRFSGRVVSCLHSGGGFNVSVHVDSRDRGLLRANNNVGGT